MEIWVKQLQESGQYGPHGEPLLPGEYQTVYELARKHYETRISRGIELPWGGDLAILAECIAKGRSYAEYCQEWAARPTPRQAWEVVPNSLRFGDVPVERLSTGNAYRTFLTVKDPKTGRETEIEIGITRGHFLGQVSTFEPKRSRQPCNSAPHAYQQVADFGTPGGGAPAVIACLCPNCLDAKVEYDHSRTRR